MSILNHLVELEMMNETEIKAKWDVPAKFVKRVLKKLLLQELLTEEEDAKDERSESAPALEGLEPRVPGRRTRRTKAELELVRAGEGSRTE